VAKHIDRITRENEPNRDQERSEDLEGQASTNQYFRFANAVIKEKIDRLKHFQDNKKMFPEIGILQNKSKMKLDLDKINLKYVTEGDVKDLITHLEDDYEKMKDRLLCQELVVEKTKDEISARRKEIDEIKEKLEKMLQKQQKSPNGATDPIEILKEELKKAGVYDKTQIYQIINDIAEELNMKNLKDQIRKD
jgi:hypothetical protein